MKPQSLRRVWLLVEKDIQESLRSSTWLFILIMPLVLAFVYTRLLSDREIRLQPVAVVGGDDKPKIMARIQQTGAFDLSGGMGLCLEEAIARARRGEFRAVVDLTCASGSSPEEARVYVDETRPSAASLVIGILTTVSGREEPLLHVTRIPLQTMPDHVKNLPLWLVLVHTIVGLSLIPQMIGEEKELGTCRAIMVLGGTIREYTFAKVVVGVLFSVIEGCLLIASTAAWGYISPMSLLVMVAGSSALCALGTLIASCFQKRNAISLVSGIVFIPLILSVSAAEISPTVAEFARFSPAFYYAEAVRSGLFGPEQIPATVKYTLVLALTAVLLMYVSAVVEEKATRQ